MRGDVPGEIRDDTYETASEVRLIILPAAGYNQPARRRQVLEASLLEHAGDVARARSGVKAGAGDGLRTRYLDLGKVALYQVSYSRSTRREIITRPASAPGGPPSPFIRTRISPRCGD